MAHPGSICTLLAAIGLLTTGSGLSIVDLHEQLDLHRISFHDEPPTDLEASSADWGRLSALAFRPIRMLAIAETMETAGGVIAKKLVEHEGVCYFQLMQGIGRTREAAAVPEQISA
jgi:hypothetical protein